MAQIAIRTLAFVYSSVGAAISIFFGRLVLDWLRMEFVSRFLWGRVVVISAIVGAFSALTYGVYAAFSNDR